VAVPSKMYMVSELFWGNVQRENCLNFGKKWLLLAYDYEIFCAATLQRLGQEKAPFQTMEGLKRRMDTGARDRNRTDTLPFGIAADFKNNPPAVKLAFMRLLLRLNQLCNFLCNATSLAALRIV